MPSLRTGDGRTLSWREDGSGPPLLCHPGGPGCSSLYFGDLPELAAERTLVLLDPRGTGFSDRAADPSAYALEDCAADVELVREQLGLERLDVLGTPATRSSPRCTSARGRCSRRWGRRSRPSRPRFAPRAPTRTP
jgi:pimeloyl-ACP methyl ester carboxylesterase